MVFDAIKKAIVCRVPFAAYAMPGSQEIAFFAQRDLSETKKKSAISFTIGQWDKSAQIVNICQQMSAAELLADNSFVDSETPFPMPNIQSTCKTEYIASLRRLIEKLKDTGGKVVISRVETEKSADFTIDYFIDLARLLFSKSQKSFRSVFYSPQTGLWLGATPELILDVDYSGRFRTMALAGTLPLDDTDWDEKNMAEHRFVVDHITHTLRALGLNPEVGTTQTLALGSFRHLLTPIEGFIEGVPAKKVLANLHPTPAISGFPVENAVAMISEYEKHHRGCYGGFLMVKDSAGTHSFLNLRCLQFAPGIICRYAGSGIVAQSDPEIEWAETTLKLSATKI